MWTIRRHLTYLLCLGICSLAGAQENEPAVAEDDPLVAQLTTDFEYLLSLDPNPQPLRQAAELLANTNRNTRWTDYKRALEQLRQLRSKAGIPLILKYRIVHGASGAGNDGEYLDALTVLTGRDFGLPTDGKDRAELARRDVADLVATWWNPKSSTIMTDMGAMSTEQLDRIAVRLLKFAASGADYRHIAENLDQAYYISAAVRQVADPSRGSHDRRTWWPEELHQALVPRVLATAGYVANPAFNEVPAVQQVCYPAIPLLAECRKNGQAAKLHLITADSRQAPATRLTCALAVYAAGEKLDTDAVLSVLDQERRLAVRLAAVISLQYSADRDVVAQRVLAILNTGGDVNREIIIAGVEVLGEVATMAAVEELAKIIEEMYPPDALDKALTMLGRIQCSQSAEALASFLAASAEDPKKAEHLEQALESFDSVTGYDVPSITSSTSPTELARLASEAVVWWREQRAGELAQ